LYSLLLISLSLSELQPIILLLSSLHAPFHCTILVLPLVSEVAALQVSLGEEQLLHPVT
jgi:hypothetical protein